MTAPGSAGANSTNVVAIHQPNFFPWLGWFHKVACADVFVLLDDVEFSRGSWTNRTRLLVNGEAVWMTAPVVRAGTQSIRHTRINDATPWRAKMLKTIENNYRRAPAFDEVYPLLSTLVQNPAGELAAYNEHALRTISEALGLGTARFVRSSDWDFDATGTDRLVRLVTALGGTTYLSGDGAGGYQDDTAFEQAGIRLAYAGFVPRPYPQRSDGFVPGLSVVDALMNLGWAGTRELLGDGRGAE